MAGITISRNYIKCQKKKKARKKESAGIFLCKLEFKLKTRCRGRYKYEKTI
jgi:hypothetical protein